MLLSPGLLWGNCSLPAGNTPMQKQINQHLAFNTNSKSSAVGSELVPVSTTISSFNNVSDMEVSSALILFTYVG